MTIANPGKIGIGTGDWTPIAGAPLNDVERAGFAWHYNWLASPLNDVDTTPETSAFIPMVWDKTFVTAHNLASAKFSGATTLLGFNEPDHPDQARMTVEQALALWPQLEATGMRLGSPATTQYGTLGAGSWLGRFMAGAESKGLEVDFIATHYYSADKDVGNFKRWLEAVHAQYNKPIWITEWALADWANPSRFSAVEQAEFARAGTEMMDDLSFVEKHAWFAAYDGGDGWDLNSGVFDESGKLTPVGEAFSTMNRPAPDPIVPAPVLPSVPADFVLNLSGDSWLGDAQFTISVDGHQIGGVRTATASHRLGQTQVFAVDAPMGQGPHEISVSFLNDAWGGTSSTDRNLFLDGAVLNGHDVPGSARAFYWSGTSSFTLNIPVTAPTPAPAPPVSAGLVLHVSGDAWLGDAQFTVSVDGQQVGGVRTATASHLLGQTQAFAINGVSAEVPHQIGVTFINDAWGGTSSTDRNLFLDGATFNGQTVVGSAFSFFWSGTSSFTLSATSLLPIPAPVLATMPISGAYVFEEAKWAVAPTTGSFEVSTYAQDAAKAADLSTYMDVAEHQLGEVLIVETSHALGLSDFMTFSGEPGAGPDAASVELFQAASPEQPIGDRHLNTSAAELDGARVASVTGVLHGSSGNFAQGTALHTPAFSVMPEQDYTLGQALPLLQYA